MNTFFRLKPEVHLGFDPPRGNKWEVKSIGHRK